MTAGDVVARIKAHLGVEWREATYRDTFKSGGPDIEIAGIATTCFVTLDVIRRATAKGLNLIVSHEDTFWNDRDDVAIVQADPLYARKRALLTASNVVVSPPPRPHARTASRFDLRRIGPRRGPRPQTRESTGVAPLRHPRDDAGSAGVRRPGAHGSTRAAVVGDPKAAITRVRLGVGYASPPVDDPEIDVLISGEQQETDGTFDSQPYAVDAAAIGLAKGLILLGHTVSEEAGMLEMARWLAGIVPELPVELVAGGEPVWDPRRADRVRTDQRASAVRPRRMWIPLGWRVAGDLDVARHADDLDSHGAPQAAFQPCLSGRRMRAWPERTAVGRSGSRPRCVARRACRRCPCRGPRRWGTPSSQEGPVADQVSSMLGTCARGGFRLSLDHEHRRPVCSFRWQRQGEAH